MILRINMHNNKDISNNITLLAIIFISIILTISCSICKNPTESNEENQSFAIYFLNDPNIKYYDIAESDLAELTLESTPWISDEDIEYYDWSSHCIYLKKDKSYFLPEWQKDSIKTFPPEWGNKPFVVVAGGKRCYMGYFEHAYSSYLSIAPVISDLCNHGYPSDILFID